MARYDAKDSESRNVKLAPWHALAMAASMKRFVKADVDRAMHVAIVKGLKRKLCSISGSRR
jgi:hypothetical protein